MNALRSEMSALQEHEPAWDSDDTGELNRIACCTAIRQMCNRLIGDPDRYLKALAGHAMFQPEQA